MEKPTSDTEPLEPVSETPRPEQSLPTEEPRPKSEPKPQYKARTEVKSWNIGRIFWGLLLVLIGALSLLDSFGTVDVNWSNLWRLWPLAIIAAGLSVLSLRNWIGRIIAVVFTIVTLVAVTAVAIGDVPAKDSGRTDEVSQKQTSGKVEQAEVSIKAGASSLRVNTADQKVIVKATLDSSNAKISQTSTTDGDAQRIVLSSEGTRQWWKGDVQSSWDVLLTRSLPLSLSVDAGASDANIDVSEGILRSIKIKAGASSIDLKLGDLVDTTTLELSSGVSSIVIRVPKDSGVRLKLNNGFSAKDLADLTEVSENTYESPAYADAAKKININGSIGVSSIRIERY